jgi:hypothetical protein
VRHLLRFDFLEDRKLLTKPPLTHLVLSGTLTVENAGANSIMNQDGSETLTVPISGELGSAGAVKGLWIQNLDANGDNMPPDVLRLHNSKGAFVVTFNNEVPGPAQKFGRGTIYHQHAQRFAAGSGPYAKSTESGSIQVVSNAAVVKSLVLNTKG